ncbi:hypothetical protein OVY01_08515 [Robbsia sp. Bb-Pol-6]|uniref:Effector protein BipC n=1 Tax=Robbsia betulipollinis TaxID=2981849 RepID=A0ABT3ZL57_9BURK|nr:hypothetical protein [Robbsia betulipollinis]MCY0387276.1 hypothetical protein [Robbsia betulipollinis]
MNTIDASLRHASLAVYLPSDTDEQGAADTATSVAAARGMSASSAVPDALLRTSAVHLGLLASLSDAPGNPAATLPPPAADALSADAGTALQRALSANADTGTLSVDITQLMALMTKFAQEVRTARSQDRTASLNTQMLSLSQSANEIREAAAKNYAATMVQGALQIGGGVLQGASATVSLGSTKAAVGAGLQSDAGQLLAARAGMQQGMGKSLSESVSGMGTMASGALVQDARNHDAEQAQDEAMAKRSEANAGTAGDAVSKMDQVIVSLRDMGRTMNQTRSDTAAAVIRNV